MGSIVVNVLSESTFLLWWTFGLWGAARFFREGRFVWLPIAIGFGALAYLTRPEGMLLPAAVVLTLLLLPMLPVTRINWPRWWRALAFLAAGLVLLVGPYVAVKGGLGTKPAIARVLGLAPRSGPLDLEREEPLAADQSPVETSPGSAPGSSSGLCWPGRPSDWSGCTPPAVTVRSGTAWCPGSSSRWPRPMGSPG
jgi:hypothetical protein